MTASLETKREHKIKEGQMMGAAGWKRTRQDLVEEDFEFGLSVARSVIRISEAKQNAARAQKNMELAEYIRGVHTN